MEMLIPHNDPNGLRIIKLAGWIGRAFVIPRADIKEIKALKEASHPAVYFLIGEEDGKATVYIGQTDNFERRLNQQVVAKNYWDIAMVFTGELDIDVQYLEYICTKEARESGRYEIKNATGTPGRNISDFQRVANNKFFENIKFVVSLLSYPIFQEVPKEQQADKIYHLKLSRSNDVLGRGALLSSGEFVVYAGSMARIVEAKSFQGRKGSGLRKQLIDEGVLQNQDGISYIFTKDYIFGSPSAAGYVITGMSTNGWTSWKDKNGKTLDENVRK